MDCEEFLRGYSDYADGLERREELRRFELHLGSCPNCARYDRIVRQGTDLFRALPRPDTSPDFLPRLRHRLYHVDDHAVLGARPGGSAALVAVAAVGMLALVWLPFASRIPVEVELAPVAVTAPSPAAQVPSLFSNGPVVAPVAYFGARAPVVELTAWGRWSDSDELLQPALLQTELSTPGGDPSR